MSTFIEDRRKGIGGSDMADLLGIGFNTPLKVYLDKESDETEEIEVRPDDPATAPMYWGKKFEDDILDAYELIQGLTVKRDIPQVIHPDKPWLVGHVDGLVTDENGEEIIIEAKEASFMASKFGEAGTDQVPPRYYVQVQHYMNVLGLKEAHLIAKINSASLIYKIKRNEKHIKYLEDVATKFWFENVQKKIPPEPITMHDVQILYPKLKKTAVKAKNEHINAVNEWILINKEIKNNKHKLEEIKFTIAKHMGANAVLESKKGERLVVCSTDKRGRRSMRILKKEGERL